MRLPRIDITVHLGRFEVTVLPPEPPQPPDPPALIGFSATTERDYRDEIRDVIARIDQGGT